MISRFLLRGISLTVMIFVALTSCVRTPRSLRQGTSHTPTPVVRGDEEVHVPKTRGGSSRVTPSPRNGLDVSIYNLADDVLRKLSAGNVSQADMECWIDLYKEYSKQYLKSKDTMAESVRQKIEYNLDAVDKVIIQNPVAGATQWTNYQDEGFQLPPYTFTNERKYSFWYTDGNMNTKMLQEACDYNLPYTKAFANHLASKDPGVYSLEQVCNIFKFCYDKWRYVNDPQVGGADFVACASESIASSLTGDCDDFAVLLSACVFAIGGNARIVTGRRSSGSGHAYAEVDVTDMADSTIRNIINDRFPASQSHTINMRTQDGCKWLNLDWQASYPGGDYWTADDFDYYYIYNGSWTWHK